MPRRARRGTWIGLLVLLASLAPVSAAEAVKVDVVSDDGARIVLDFKLLEYRLDPVRIGERDFVEVVIPGEAVSLEKGSPALPHVSRSVIVPDDAEMALTVVSATFRDIPARVAPSKGNLPRTVDPASVPYSLGAVYGVDSFYPETVVSLGRPYVLRDWRGIAVRWNPFQYNPASGTLRVYDETRVEINKIGISTTNVLDRKLRPGPPVTGLEPVYAAHFINYGSRQSASYAPLSEMGDLLIIAHDPWIPDLEPLVSHKEALGIHTVLVGVSTIGNDAASIKSYIQGYYNTHDLAFVLLVGDSNQVATPLLNNYDASDPSYSKLSGDDDYPDVLVGRFSAQTAEQVDTQVQRTIEYENLPATVSDWYWRGVGIASDQGAGAGDEGQSDHDHIEEIRGWLLGGGYTVIDQIYDPGATAQQVADSLNAGRGIVDYCGHGSAVSWGTTGFSTTEVANLSNEDQLPFIFSVACNNGEFNHYDPCFGEAWLRATRDGRPTGAIATYMSSISQSWAPPMEAEDEFNLLLSNPDHPYSTFGALCYAGSSSMMDAYGADGVAMFNTWHVFGDPSVRVAPGAKPSSGMWVRPGNGLIADGQAGGPFSPGTKSYTIENVDLTPLEYEVAAAAPWLAISSGKGTLAGGASVTVTVSFNDRARELDFGAVTDTLRFVNRTTHVGDSTRPVSLAVGKPLVMQRQLLDIDPGWTRQGEWQFGTPTGGGGGTAFYPDPISGKTGINVFGANLHGNISGRPGGPYFLRAGPFDLTGVHGATLRFWRWLNMGTWPSVTATLDVSRDGTTWTSVWSAGGQVVENQWTQQSYDISTVADGQPSVYIRWGYQVLLYLPGGTGSGWNIDDIEIWGKPGTAKVELRVEPDRLTWGAVAGVPLYDVVRGDLGSLRAGHGDFASSTQACIANDVTSTSLANGDAPSGGTGLWYLVRGSGYAGALTYQDLDVSQSGSRDDGIDASGSACP